MVDEGEKSVACLRWLVFSMNLFFWVAGVGTLGVALWLCFDPGVRHAISVDGGLSHYYLAVYILIGVGVVLTCLGFFGCCGAWQQSQWMLTAFFVLLVLVFACEFACAMIAYTHQNDLKQYVEKSMYDAVHLNYSRNPSYTKMFDEMQEELKCCGVHSYTDWLESYYSTKVIVHEKPEIGIGASEIGRVPPSCCNDNGKAHFPVDCGESFDQSANELRTYKHYIHSQGCADALYAQLYNNLGVVIAVAVIIGILQLFGMVISMLYCCCIGVRKKEERKHDGY